ncbi:hypothetical protein M2O49_004295 [Citrobacter amalonaticus]|nr:hypothetical protein [Citrobacter amalonaticus]
MATQPTNLPVPSESPRDLKFNAGKIDEFVTSLVNTYIDRFGNTHYTIEGLRWLAHQAISQYGWIPVGTFQAGATLTLPNQILKDETDGEYYRWDGALPKTVTENSTPESTGGFGIGAWISVGDSALRSMLASNNGASAIGSSNGMTLQEIIERGVVYISDLPGVTIDGSGDCAASVNNLISQIASTPGRKGVTEIRGISGHTYRFDDWIDTRGVSNLTFDFNYATVVDNVQGVMPDDNPAGVDITRSKPLFVAYNNENVKACNINYTVSPTRGNLFPSTSVVTIVFWAGGQQLGQATTKNVEFSNINVVNQSLPGGMLMTGTGELDGFVFKNIYLSGGDWGYGYNLEWGEPAPTDPATDPSNINGRHPHNGLIENFSIEGQPTIVAAMRFAGCYNIIVRNCEMYNVQKGIEYYSGDKGVSRYSQNIIFENFKFKTNISRAVNAVSIFAPDVLNSTPLPSWTNFEHLIKFVNCEFHGNTSVGSSGLRFLGCDGKVTFDSCKFSGWYRANHIDNSSQVTYLLEDILNFISCEFDNNVYDSAVGHIANTSYIKCTFKNQNSASGSGTTSDTCPIQIGTAAIRTKLSDCSFMGIIAGRSYINVNSSAPDTKIDDCVFRMGDSTTPSLLLASRTHGYRNSSSSVLVSQSLSSYVVRGDTQTEVKALNGAGTLINRDCGGYFLSSAGGTSIASIINGIIGDVICFRGGGSSSSVTFQHAAGSASTANRLLLKSGANETVTGANWAKTFRCFSTGWYEM